MSKNPEVQEQLYKEINTVLHLNQQITQDHISQLKYLKNSVKENLRCNMIVPANARILQEDLMIDDFLIPKGVFYIFSMNFSLNLILYYRFILKTTVNIGTAYITKSERFFKDPLKFDPNRWDVEEISNESIDPYTNLPFGFLLVFIFRLHF